MRDTSNGSSIDYNASGSGDRMTRQSNHENNPGGYTSLLQDDNENPWDVHMFNDIQLDQVLDSGTLDTEEQSNEPTATQNSEGRTRSGVYHGELPGTPEMTMPSTMIHLQKSTHRLLKKT